MGAILDFAKLFDTKHTVTINSNGEAKLEETESSAKLKEVILKGLTRESCILRLEGHIGRVFQEGCKARKCCDYIVLTEVDGDFHRLYIELKSSCPKGDKRREALNQLKSAECIMRYFDDVLETFFNKADFFRHFESRYFVLYAGSINKQSPNFRWKANSSDAPHFFCLTPNKCSAIPIRRLTK